MENERILVVDDDLSILKSFGSLLEMKGYRVSEATGAGEAITKASSNFYHLALIDVKLPDLDGTELLREFSQINPEMMKIIITGYASLDNAIISLNQGADGYLVKPVFPGHLLEMWKICFPGKRLGGSGPRTW